MKITHRKFFGSNMACSISTKKSGFSHRVHLKAVEPRGKQTRRIDGREKKKSEMLERA